MDIEIRPVKRSLVLEITVLVSVLVHAAAWAVTTKLGTRPASESYLVQMVIPDAVPTPTPPPPTPIPKPTPPPATPPPPPPNTTKPVEETTEPPKPIFGVTDESVVDDSSVSVRVGNTLMKSQEDDFTDPSKVKPYAGPEKKQAIKASAPPKLKYKVNPVYPALARTAGREGRAVVRVLIGGDGRVISVTLVREDPPDFGFGQSAVEAVEKWVYSAPPGGIDTWFFQPIKFNLQD